MTVRAYSEVCEHKGLQLLIRVCFLEPWAGEWQRQSSRGVLKKSCHPWTLAVSAGEGASWFTGAKVRATAGSVHRK